MKNKKKSPRFFAKIFFSEKERVKFFVNIKQEEG